MLVPLLGTIQPQVRFDRATAHFWIGRSTPAPFSILDQYGLPLIFQLARAGESPWTFGSALGFPLAFSVALFVTVELALALGLRSALRGPKKPYTLQSVREEA